MTAAAIAVAAGAVAQAVSGFGFSLVCSSFLIAALGRVEAVRLNLLLSAVLNVVLLAGNRRANWSVVFALLLPAAIATPVFAVLFHNIHGRPLPIAAGALTIASAVALAVGLRVERARGRMAAIAAGIVSAGMNALAGIGGPPVAMYAVNADLTPATIRPTLQAYFLGLDIVAIAALGLPKATAAPWIALVAGWVLGAVALRRLPERAARPAILLVAAVGGIVAIIRARA